MKKPKLIEIRKKQILEKQPPGPPEWKIIETNQAQQTNAKNEGGKKNVMQKIRGILGF